MKNRISKTAEDFLKYGFKGDGRYHLYCYGSRKYNLTTFSHFAKFNSDCYEVISEGNDAQRGGTVGIYQDIKFNDNFYNKFGDYLQELKEAEEKEKKRKEEREKELEKAIENFRLFIEKNPQKKEEFINKVNDTSLNCKKRRMKKTHIVNNILKDFNRWDAYFVFDSVIR